MTTVVTPVRLLDEIVIGLDGAERSQGALDWVVEVVPSGGIVHAVHAVRPESHPDAVEPEGDLDDWVAALRDALARRGSDARVVAHVVADSPALALVSVARAVDACLIVVGSHDQVFEHPRLLGRTVTRLVHESPVPLAIVGTHHAVGADGTVVVGVGTGEPTTRAVAWAAAFAEQHRLGLGLVRAVRREPFFTPEGVLALIAYYLDPGVLNRWALEDLQHMAAEVQQATGTELGIEWSAPVGRLGPELVEASEAAELLVIGRPTRPAALDHVVPAWLHHAISHAPCPVIVVPADGDD